MANEAVENVISSGDISIGFMAVVLFGVFLVIGIRRMYKTPMSDEAYVITGMGSGKIMEVEERNPEFIPENERDDRKKYIESQLQPLIKRAVKYNKVMVGGGGVVYPEPFQKINKVPLGATRIPLAHESLISGNKVPVDISATIYLRVPAEEKYIVTASQNFRNMSKEQLADFVRESLDGHIRGIVAQKTPEEINENLEDISKEVMRISQPDMEKLGLSIVNFVINKVINDKYFGDLAKPREVQVERDARIATADADKDARLREAEAKAKAVEREQKTAEQIAQFERDAKVKQEEMRKEEETATAEADLANKLKSAEVNERVTEKEQAVEIMRQEKEKEVQSKKAEAEGEYITKIAEFEKTKTITNAEAEKRKQIEEAEGIWEAKRIEEMKLGEGERQKEEERAKGIEAIGKAEGEAERAKGTGEADAIKAKKLAEADGTKELMKALNEMGEDAKQIEAMKLVTKILPEVAKEVAEGAGNMGEKMTYVDLGGGNGDGNGVGDILSKNIIGIASAVPAVLKSQGINLDDVLSGKVKIGKEDIVKAIEETESKKVEKEVDKGEAV